MSLTWDTGRASLQAVLRGAVVDALEAARSRDATRDFWTGDGGAPERPAADDDPVGVEELFGDLLDWVVGPGRRDWDLPVDPTRNPRSRHLPGELGERLWRAERALYELAHRQGALAGPWTPLEALRRALAMLRMVPLPAGPDAAVAARALAPGCPDGPERFPVRVWLRYGDDILLATEIDVLDYLDRLPASDLATVIVGDFPYTVTGPVLRAHGFPGTACSGLANEIGWWLTRPVPVDTVGVSVPYAQTPWARWPAACAVAAVRSAVLPMFWAESSQRHPPVLALGDDTVAGQLGTTRAEQAVLALPARQQLAVSTLVWDRGHLARPRWSLWRGRRWSDEDLPIRIRQDRVVRFNHGEWGLAGDRKRYLGMLSIAEVELLVAQAVREVASGPAD